MLGQKGEQRVSDQGQIGQEVGILAAGLVLAENDVPSPMVADFHSGPVPTNEPQPLLRAVLVWRCAGQVVVRFGRALTGLFEVPSIAQDDQSSGETEVCGQRFDGEGMELAGFDSTVSGLGLFKKGVS